MGDFFFIPGQQFFVCLQNRFFFSSGEVYQAPKLRSRVLRKKRGALSIVLYGDKERTAAIHTHRMMNVSHGLGVHNENIMRKKRGLFQTVFGLRSSPSFRDHFRQKKVYTSIVARVLRLTRVSGTNSVSLEELNRPETLMCGPKSTTPCD